MACAASLLFSLSIVAFVRGAADLASVPARVAMADWERQQQIGTEEDWERAYNGLRFARSVNPSSADYSADLGRLLEWRAWRHTPGSTEHVMYREHADRFYRNAIRQRPSWGFGWAHLAENRLLRGLLDESYLLSLQKAMDLAPWEPGVQRKVARMGMASWGSLPESVRSDVRDTVQRALDLSVYADDIVRFAFHYEWTHELLPLIRTQSQQDTYDFVSRQLDIQ